MADEIEFYGDSISGNCYKLRLACAELGIAYRWHEIDILAGESRTPEFLAMNPQGKVPLMALADGRYLPESNAILSYLADGSDLNGGDRYSRANILQWMFFEQYSHEPFIATSRFIVKYLGSPAGRQGELDAKKSGGYKALAAMEARLSLGDYVAGDRFTIADIALFAYTHVAPEGGFELDRYTAIGEWIDRISSRENFVPMQVTE